jgi:hypothetical protein
MAMVSLFLPAYAAFSCAQTGWPSRPVWAAVAFGFAQN